SKRSSATSPRSLNSIARPARRVLTRNRSTASRHTPLDRKPTRRAVTGTPKEDARKAYAGKAYRNKISCPVERKCQFGPVAAATRTCRRRARPETSLILNHLSAAAAH